MQVRKTLTSIVLAGTLAPGGVGCSKPENHVEGKVIQEYGSVARIVQSSGALFGNESVKLGNPIYGLKVETPQGIYIIHVDIDDSSGSQGPHTAYNLAAAIEEGTRVRFPLRYDGRNLFSADKLGIVDPDDITILGK